MCLEGGKMSKYYEIVKKLQDDNKGKIILVRNGIFYCAIGKDGKRSTKRRIETF